MACLGAVYLCTGVSAGIGQGAGKVDGVVRSDVSGRVLMIVPKTLVLVGLMGAGKTAIGRRVASRLGLPFADADLEIELAAGCSVQDIFATYGEPAFRDVERKVIARLLDGPVQVLATGGGAYMDPSTRATIAQRGISLWLRADLETLLARTARRNNRPLLQNGDPRSVLTDLIERRYPVYAEADLVVDSSEAPPEQTVDIVMDTLRAYLDRQPAEAGAA